MADHLLVVTDDGEGGREWDVEHPDGCPTWTLTPDARLGVPPVVIHTCDVGVLAAENDDYGVAWRELPPGRYRIEAWYGHTPPSTPSFPAEWDAGLAWEETPGEWGEAPS